jgi:hypothetical protein
LDPDADGEKHAGAHYTFNLRGQKLAARVESQDIEAVEEAPDAATVGDSLFCIHKGIDIVCRVNTGQI